MANTVWLHCSITWDIFYLISVLNLLQLIYHFALKKDTSYWMWKWDQMVLLPEIMNYCTKYFREAQWFILVPCTFTLPSRAEKVIIIWWVIIALWSQRTFSTDIQYPSKITYFTEVGQIEQWLKTNISASTQLSRFYQDNTVKKCSAY